MAGVDSVDASHAEQRVIVSFDPGQVSLDAVKAKIAALGYQVVAQA
jgi:copper chaperone CopZ